MRCTMMKIGYTGRSYLLICKSNTVEQICYSGIYCLGHPVSAGIGIVYPRKLLVAY